MSNLFARNTQDTIMIEGESLLIRKLTGKEVELAQAEHMKSFVNGRSTRGWSGAMTRLLNGLGTEVDAQAVAADPLAGFDRSTVAKCGWLELGGEKVTPAQVDGLTDEALETIALGVMRLTKPDLFLSAEGRAAARKND